MGTPDTTAEWWTTTDVASYLGVTVGTVSSYRGRGQMPAPDQTIGRTHVWRPARIIEWHQARPGRGGRSFGEIDRHLEHAGNDAGKRRRV
jgi:hypothetical protein